MSVPRRVLPDGPGRRGWCPGLARPMPTGDGLLARIHPPLGILTRAQLHAVTEAANRFGNGHVDVTARANLQLRGVTEATRPGLVAALASVGLGDVRDDGGPQRLTLTSPLSDSPADPIDVQALARSIEAAGLGIAGLPAKTLVLIAGGTDLAGIEADLHVLATGIRLALIGLAEGDGVAWVAEYREADVVGVMATLLRGFAATGRRRMRDLTSAERDVLTRLATEALRADGTACIPLPPLRGRMAREAGRERGATVPEASLPSPDPRSREGHPPPQGEEGSAASRYPMPDGARSSSGPNMIVRAEAPFGRCTAAMLERLADLARALGTDEIRLSPTRGFVLTARDAAPGMLAEARTVLSAAGFVTARDDPRRAVAACPGAPACGSGSTPTGRDAARLAEAFRPFAARGLTAHVSGCAKGCAHPARADLTLVGRHGRYGIVLDGAPGDASALELTFEAALERVCRAGSGTLADAFRTPSFGHDARAEPALGTTP